MKESQIQKQILDYLRHYGDAFRINNVGVYDKKKGAYRTSQTKGIPDIYFIHRHITNCAIWFEVKTQRGKLSDAQKYFQELCITRGIEHHVVRSLEDVQEVVNERY